MAHRFQNRRIKNAISISVLINLCMLLAAFFPGRHHVLTQFSDIIAAPPGVIINLVFAPNQHSPGAFMFAAAESLALSVLFYAVVAWVILKVASFIRSRAGGSEGLVR
jgi:hypothetical protein